MGYAGLGQITVSPGAVIAWARFANPSLDPIVAITSVSGFSFTP
jgi:hypothetical protein